MALLSMDMIRDIQGVVDTYAVRERERLLRANAEAVQRVETDNARRPSRTRDGNNC